MDDEPQSVTAIDILLDPDGFDQIVMRLDRIES